MIKKRKKNETETVLYQKTIETKQLNDKKKDLNTNKKGLNTIKSLPVEIL
jgi:hypothetical protein